MVAYKVARAGLLDCWAELAVISVMIVFHCVFWFSSGL